MFYRKQQWQGKKLPFTRTNPCAGPGSYWRTFIREEVGEWEVEETIEREGIELRSPSGADVTLFDLPEQSSNHAGGRKT